jgi:hypothetical protein
MIVNNVFAYGINGEVFYAQSISLVVGTMDQLWQTFCHTFEIMLEITRWALITVFQELAMQILSK